MRFGPVEWQDEPLNTDPVANCSSELTLYILLQLQRMGRKLVAPRRICGTAHFFLGDQQKVPAGATDLLKCAPDLLAPAPDAHARQS
jgi:hypothetical protein